MDILSDKVNLQVAVELTAAALAFQAAKDHLFCLVKSIHYLAVLASERHAAGLYINAPYRLKQRRFQNQELTQGFVHPCHALFHRLAGEQRAPHHRNRSVPGGTGQQQQLAGGDVLIHTAVLFNIDHGVDRKNERSGGNGCVTLANRPQHDQRKGGHRQTRCK